jgi:uncharacterized protein (DUF2267 family)
VSALHLFDSHLETANRWIKELIEELQLTRHDYPRALPALRAGLHAIRDRLPPNEVLDLGAQLPTLIRGIYFDGWTLHRDAKAIRDRAAMIARVKQELAPDLRIDPVNVLRAVIRMLERHVSAGEIRDIVATLPKPVAALWRELATDMPPSPAPSSRNGYVRRTGYAR